MNTQDLPSNPERDRLKPYFDMVCDPEDWKAPIGIHVSLWDLQPEGVDLLTTLNLIQEAVQFFTATDATFECVGDNKIRITAVGYRNGPAGP